MLEVIDKRAPEPDFAEELEMQRINMEIIAELERSLEESKKRKRRRKAIEMLLLR